MQHHIVNDAVSQVMFGSVVVPDIVVAVFLTLHPLMLAYSSADASTVPVPRSLKVMIGQPFLLFGYEIDWQIQKRTRRIQ